MDGCEVFWFFFKIVNRKILYILFFYRLLNFFIEIFDYLDDFFNNVFLRVLNYFNIIMGGDLNLGDIDWN